ncbi:MAG: helix-turn-helix domain-containing protein [Prevotella sp.]|jgi:HTH-type transcriptional regulator/antitoxin HigA|nr:helix-turn-helix domain-containing protein [Prevotella sp.]
MTQIKNETQYKASLKRIEELLKVVSNETPATDKDFIELELISNLVADYEEVHYPIKPLSLVETMELRMFEMGLTRKKLSEMLNLSKSTISDILTGKREPTLKTAREISRKLNIDASVVLGA